MDDLDTLIRQAEADVAERESRVAAADARVTAAKATVTAAEADAAAEREDLGAARIVLEWLRRRKDGQPAAASPEDGAGQPEPQPQMRFGKPVPEGPPKLQQCLDALEELGGIASNKQISSRLLRDGIEINAEHVRGLMKYASSKKPSPVVTQPGSGVWRLVRSLNGAGGER